MSNIDSKNDKIEDNKTTLSPQSTKSETIESKLEESEIKTSEETEIIEIIEEQSVDNLYADIQDPITIDQKELKELIVKSIHSKTIKDIRERSCSISKVENNTFYVDVIDK